VISLFCTGMQDAVLRSIHPREFLTAASQSQIAVRTSARAKPTRAVLHVSWYACWAARAATDTLSHADVKRSATFPNLVTFQSTAT
jgi:hypothetical protein